MSDRDELQKVIYGYFGPTNAINAWRTPEQQDRELAATILAAGYAKPRTIETAEDLDGLRFQAVVLDAYGTPYVCERHRTDGTRNEWKPSGMDHLEDSETIIYHGPAVVVHEGEPTK